jgi:hypothetical protein
MRLRLTFSCGAVLSLLGCEGSNVIGLRVPDATLFDASDAADAPDESPPDVMIAPDVIDVLDASMDADVPDVPTCGMLDFDVPTVDVPARDGGADVSDVPSDVVLPAAPAMQVEASLANTGFTCFGLTSAEGRCVGDNNLGQLGDGTNTARARPVVVGNLFGARALATGDAFACALLDNGTVRCWGANAYGQFGDGSMTDRRAATPVANITSAVQVSVGQNHVCARLGDGTVQCWGRNHEGQVGNGTASMT